MLYRILLIDDDEISAFISKKILVRSGYCKEVLTARTGSSGVKLVKQQLVDKEKIDIVFLDLDLPMASGHEFLKELSTLENLDINQLFIIILSNSLDENEISTARLLGANHFIPKPLDENSLYDAFERFWTWKSH